MAARNFETREGFDFWDRLCSIPRYAFLLSKAGNSVQKAEGLGNWIDRDEAMVVMDDAQCEINVLRQDCATMIAELDDLRAKASQGGEAVAWQIRSMTNHPGSKWTPWRECGELERAMHSAEAGKFNRHGILREFRPLYTHPADQVEDDLTMVKVSRELLERLYTSNSKYQFDPKTYWPAHEELRALLAKPCQHIPLTSKFGTWCELCETKLN